MKPTVTGIHHITAIASDPQANLDFYTRLLGLRLVKQTVNFDDPSAYHLYYGDETGSAGSIVTFFYWPGLAARGRIGSGQSTALVFSAAPDALPYWKERLDASGVAVQHLQRFDESALRFADSDGIPVEIVAVRDDHRIGWSGTDVPESFRLRGLHTVELTLRDGDATERLLLERMDFRSVRQEGARGRFEAGPGGSGHFVDLVIDPEQPAGRGGNGTIHHVAWSVPDDEVERHMQAQLRHAGFHVSQVRDRDYFHSIYWPEPGGVLFEIATENPGFTIDEPVEGLGGALQLPKQFQHARDLIEKSLPPLRTGISTASSSPAEPTPNS